MLYENGVLRAIFLRGKIYRISTYLVSTCRVLNNNNNKNVSSVYFLEIEMYGIRKQIHVGFRIVLKKC